MEYLSSFEDFSNLAMYITATITTIAALIISTRYILKVIRCTRNETEKQMEKLECDERKDSAPPTSNDPNDGDDEMEEKGDDGSPSLSPRYPDPVDYCEHIQGEIKRVQQKVATKSIAETLTEDQLREEREIQRQQLADIFRLMQEQQDRFGIGTMDDMQEQMKLYTV